MHQCGFACPRASDQADAFAGADVQVYFLQHLFAALICKTQLVKSHFALADEQGLGVGLVCHI